MYNEIIAQLSEESNPHDLFNGKFQVELKSWEGKPAEGKVGAAQVSAGEVREVTITELVQHLAYEGGAIFPGVCDIVEFTRQKVAGREDLQPHYDKNGAYKFPIHRRKEFFRHIQILLIDIDDGLVPGTPAETITAVFEKYPTLAGKVAAIFPSSSYTDEKPKIHMVCVLDQPITVYAEYKKLYKAVMAEFGLTPDRAMESPVQTLYGTQFKKESYLGRAVTPDMVYLDTNAFLSVEWLRSLLPAEAVEEIKAPAVARAKVEGLERWQANKRKGLKTAQKEALALGKFILDTEIRLRTLKRGKVAALTASLKTLAGEDAACELIANHEIWNSTGYATSSIADSIEGILAWQPDDDEFDSVKYLYSMAGQRGYGTTSPMDITADSADLIFNERYVSDGITELPVRALVKSFTSSGKTYLLKRVLADLPKGKQAIIIAPLKTLVNDIYNSLIEWGFNDVAYYATGNNIKLTDELRAAKILCITPQSAAKLLDHTHTIENYGLLWCEEISQIIQAAIHPGNEKDALYKHWHTRGFMNLVNIALQSGIRVWGVDAGLTKVAVDWFKSINTDTAVIVNTFQPDKGIAVEHQTPEKALAAGLAEARRGKKVYFVCDTVDGEYGTNAITRMLAAARMDMSKVKVIDGDTKGNPEYVQNLEENLKTVDILVASPTLKSGVSIESWIPDVTVAVYTHLTPRDFNQAVHRARGCQRLEYFMGTPRLLEPIMTIAEGETRQRTQYNAMVDFTGLSAQQDDITVKRMHLMVLEEIDNQAQLQLPKWFTRAILKSEGHTVEFAEENSGLHDVFNDARKNDPTKDYIRSNWPDAPIRNKENPPPDEEPVLITKAGRAKNTIEGMTRGNYDLAVTAAEDVYDTVMDGIDIETLEQVVEGTGKEMAHQMLTDMVKPTLTPDDVELDSAIAACFATLADFVIDLELTAETLVEKSERFIRMVERVKGAYDLIVDNRQRWLLVYDAKDVIGTAKDIAKNILAVLGIKLRRAVKTTLLNPQTNARLYNYEVTNKDKAILLLKWRNPNKAILKVIFRSDEADYMNSYRAMNKAEQQKVVDRVNGERYTDFETAVWSVWAERKGEAF